MLINEQWEHTASLRLIGIQKDTHNFFTIKSEFYAVFMNPE